MTVISDGTDRRKIAMLLSVVAGLLMMLCLGIFFGWSIFIIPLEEALKCDRDEISMVYTINMACFCIGALLLSKLISGGKRFVAALLIITLLLFCGFLFSGMATQPWHLYLSYGLLVGAGIGGGYTSILSTVVGWFPHRSGTISGIMLMGYGLGSLVFGTICPFLIDKVGIRMLFTGFAVVYAAIFLLGAAALRKAFKMLPPFKPLENRSEHQIESPMRKTIRDPKFIMHYLVVGLAGTCCLTFIGNLVPIGVEIGTTQTFASFLVGMVSLFNGCGRIVTGIGYDRLGFTKMYLIVIGLIVTALCCLCLAVHLRSIPFFAVVCAMVGLGLSGLPTGMAVLVLKCFGSRYYSENVAAFNTVQVIQSLGNAVFIHLMTAFGNYSTACLLFLPVTAVAAICGLNLARMSRREKALLKK